jgi:hypothetical protein
MAFAGTAVMPFESRDFGQINHGLHVMNAYKQMQAERTM